MVVPIASAKKDSFILGIFPSLTNPPLYKRLTSVPKVSKRSMNKKEKTTITISTVKMLCHSNFMKIGSTEGGVETKPSKWVRPNGMPQIVVIAIPISKAPGIFLTRRTAVEIKPTITSNTLGWKIWPRATRVASFLTEIPAFWRPIKAIKRPIPTPIAFWILGGRE